MPLTRLVDAPAIQTPNAVMRTLVSPTLHHSALAVWEATLEPGATGPEHLMDADQVYVVLGGSLAVMVEGTFDEAGAGDSVFVPGGTLRQISNAGGTLVSFVVAMPGGAHVSTPSGSHHGELPWAR